MFKIKDHAHYVDILEKLQALEEQTKEKIIKKKGKS